jgi:hypothetical protein
VEKYSLKVGMWLYTCEIRELGAVSLGCLAPYREARLVRRRLVKVGECHWMDG